jgi:hypothetical protein
LGFGASGLVLIKEIGNFLGVRGTLGKRVYIETYG